MLKNFKHSTPSLSVSVIYSIMNSVLSTNVYWCCHFRTPFVLCMFTLCEECMIIVGCNWLFCSCPSTTIAHTLQLLKDGTLKYFLCGWILCESDKCVCVKWAEGSDSPGLRPVLPAPQIKVRFFKCKNTSL